MESNKNFAIILSFLLIVGLFVVASADIYGPFGHDHHDHDDHGAEDHDDHDDHDDHAAEDHDDHDTHDTHDECDDHAAGIPITGASGESNASGGSTVPTNVALYAIVSAILVGGVALAGLVWFPFEDIFSRYLPRIVSFAIGALIGGSFLHLLPHLLEVQGSFTVNSAMLIIFGFSTMFILENLIGHTHTHPADRLDSAKGKGDKEEDSIKSSAFLISVGDGVHNLLDGLIIGSVYMASIPSGIAITIATIMHEIPLELADYGILINSGLSKAQALMVNAATGLATVTGVIVSLVLINYVPGLQAILFAIGIGNFVYIAAACLLPDLLREEQFKSNLYNLASMLIGVLLMLLLILVEQATH